MPIHELYWSCSTNDVLYIYSRHICINTHTHTHCTVLVLVRNAEGCYRVSLFLNTSSRNLQNYRQVHPSLIASEQEVFFSNTRSSHFFFGFEKFASKMRFSGMYINAFSRNSIKAETRGSWRTIVVDDLVPVDSNGPRACRPGDSRATALWPSIIEKAFAKACGSYEKMDFVGS